MCLHIPVVTHRLSTPETKGLPTSLGETSLLLFCTYFLLFFFILAVCEQANSLCVHNFVGKVQDKYRLSVTPVSHHTAAAASSTS